MVELTENLGNIPAPAGAVALALDFEQRSRTRQRVRLDDGREAAVMLPHGKGMKAGDVLCGPGGLAAVVQDKPEEVVTVRAGDWLSLSRAAYHFGNRHVALQVGELFLRFQPDPVLEKMAASLGLSVQRECAVFVPEPGVGRHAHHETAGHHHHHGE